MSNIRTATINSTNLAIYMNLATAYEAEFSRLTGEMPSAEGLFAPGTVPGDKYKGFLLFVDDCPVGFAVVDILNQPHDVAEFYVVPVMRQQGLGLYLAETVFRQYPGAWQVRQIEGADEAIKFWRRVISRLSNDNYLEEVVSDPAWGTVTRQRFSIKPAPYISEPTEAKEIR